MRALTFGSASRAAEVIADIKNIHARVNGRLRTAVGIFPAGTRYSAEDPDLLLWVHATLVDSIPRLYATIVQPLSAPELDAYCEQAADVAVALGAGADAVPRTWAVLTAYMTAMYDSGVLAVGPDARALAKAVLAPPFPVLGSPLAVVGRRLTFGALPDRIRDQYGESWDGRRERQYRRLVAGLGLMRRAMPRAVALWPEARRARP
jgi:uncharacterized protein (DUF2236 family)